MGTPRYPSERGVALPTQEIWLPKTSLSDSPENKNNHHREYIKRRFGSSILFMVFRDFACHQEVMFKDVHKYLHDRYDMPKFPTPLQAIEEVEKCYYEGDQLKYRENGRYVLRSLSSAVLDLCKKEYERLK